MEEGLGLGPGRDAPGIGRLGIGGLGYEGTGKGKIHTCFGMDQLGRTKLPGWSASHSHHDMEFHGVQDGFMANDLNDDNAAGVNQASASQVRHRRQIRIHRNFPELIVGSESDILEYETEEEEDALMGDVATNGVRHVFCDEIWSQSSFTYDPKPRDFIGRRSTA
jgi:hypothetical protein